MKSAIVLLSGGLDSTVNLYAAKANGLDVKLALTFSYGQRAVDQEILAAKTLSGLLGVPHQVISLPWMADVTQTSLVNREQNVPTGQAVAIDDFKKSEQTAKSVWVPNRNGVFLNIAAAFAESLGCHYVVPGFNAEEAATFPDNSDDFLQQATKSLSFSTANHVEVKCFTTHLGKVQIFVLAKELGVPVDLVWSCYFGGEVPCGQCESCQRFERARREAKVLQ